MIPVIPQVSLQIASTMVARLNVQSLSSGLAAKLGRVVQVRGGQHRVCSDETFDQARKRFKDATVAPT